MFQSNITTLIFYNTIFFGMLYIKPIVSFCKSLGGKCAKWNQLTKIVSLKHKNKIAICWYSLLLLYEAAYIGFIQYINKSVQKLKHGTYLVTYTIEGKVYKMFVIPTRGPSPVMNITDENSNDVTKMVLPYMGPNYNWHGISITPKNLEYEQLSFQLSNGSNYTYNSTDSMA